MIVVIMMMKMMMMMIIIGVVIVDHLPAQTWDTDTLAGTGVELNEANTQYLLMTVTLAIW